MTTYVNCRRDFVRDDDTEVEVVFAFTPGTPEQGNYGPPEHYDPGSGPEIEVQYAVLAGDADERVQLDDQEIDRFTTETIEDSGFEPD